MNPVHPVRVGGVRITGQSMFMAFERPVAEEPAPVPVAIVDKRPIAFNRDFSSCRWGTETFSFTKKQRPVVAALWAARSEDIVVLSTEYLLEISESEGTRLRDVFKNHPAWGTMIVRAEMEGMGLGGYMLADPPEEE